MIRQFTANVTAPLNLRRLSAAIGAGFLFAFAPLTMAADFCDADSGACEIRQEPLLVNCKVKIPPEKTDKPLCIPEDESCGDELVDGDFMIIKTTAKQCLYMGGEIIPNG